MTETVRAIINELKPDLIWCSRTASLQFLPKDHGSVVLLDQHDLSSQLWTSLRNGATKWWIRYFAGFNLKLIEQYERVQYRRVDVIVSVSAEEQELTRVIATPGTDLLLAPNGVDVSVFKPSVTNNEEPGALVSVGSMDQERNIDAAEFFVNLVLPLLRSRGLDVVYYIVGQNPTARVRRLGEWPDVVVTGMVDDVRPFIDKASIVVAPYRSGSGVKHKIPIAFAMAKAVVATTNACQGISVSHGENVMIADTPQLFADAIQRLLNDRNLRQKIGTAAKALVESTYSWNIITDKLIEDLNGVLLKRRTVDLSPAPRG